MKVTILGCGVYGLALANSFLSKDFVKVTMWSKFQDEVDYLSKKYFHILFSTDMESATKGADLVVIAIPVAFLEETMKSYCKVYHGEDILIASKGINIEDGLFASQIIEKYLNPNNIGAISGGTFAGDMLEKKVMGLTLGTKSKNLQNKVKKCLQNRYLKIQYTNDIIGIQICGAIKNVMAIGFGILDGAKYPESTRFLFLTEAIYEINKLIIELNGDDKTIMSYAGIDDIMMTCTSNKSRNYTLGKMIGENIITEEINNYKKNTTIEGLGTAKAIKTLCKEKQINLEICNILYEILYNNQDKDSLIKYLEEKES